jgi:cytochrome c5
VSKADDLFFKEFGAILVVLTLFTVAMFFLARSIGGNAFHRIQNAPSMVAARIAPVGKARLDGDAVPQAATPKAAAAPAPAATTATAEPAGEAGEKVYASACAACHVAGVAGAPKFGDQAAWQPRFEQGLDALVASVLKGKGAMPPKGGNASLSEDDIRAAVLHIMGGSGIAAAPAGAAPAPAPATEAATAATEQAPAAPVATASAGKPGDQVYQSACMACHVAGVAGAPKTGDNAAWAPRAGAGIETLVATVIKGKGAMPPKGGNASLTEDDIRNAVRYLLEKAGISG